MIAQSRTFDLSSGRLLATSDDAKYPLDGMIQGMRDSERIDDYFRLCKNLIHKESDHPDSKALVEELGCESELHMRGRRWIALNVSTLVDVKEVLHSTKSREVICLSSDDMRVTSVMVVGLRIVQTFSVCKDNWGSTIDARALPIGLPPAHLDSEPGHDIEPSTSTVDWKCFISKEAGQNLSVQLQDRLLNLALDREKPSSGLYDEGETISLAGNDDLHVRHDRSELSILTPSSASDDTGHTASLTSQPPSQQVGEEAFVRSMGIQSQSISAVTGGGAPLNVSTQDQSGGSPSLGSLYNYTQSNRDVQDGPLSSTAADIAPSPSLSEQTRNTDTHSITSRSGDRGDTTSAAYTGGSIGFPAVDVSQVTDVSEMPPSTASASKRALWLRSFQTLGNCGRRKADRS